MVVLAILAIWTPFIRPSLVTAARPALVHPALPSSGDRIQAAFLQGAIDSEQRLLLLAEKPLRSRRSACPLPERHSRPQRHPPPAGVATGLATLTPDHKGAAPGFGLHTRRWCKISSHWERPRDGCRERALSSALHVDRRRRCTRRRWRQQRSSGLYSCRGRGDGARAPWCKT